MKANCDTPGLMPIEQAMNIMMDAIVPIAEASTCYLSHAVDRVIAQDIISPIQVPAYDNSAMDGYAFKYADYLASNTLVQVGKSFAGSNFEGQLSAGQCIRIMTGGAIPVGADTVVMQENTVADGHKITIMHASKGDAIRPAGDDIQKGALVLPKGHRITPLDIGLLASLGIPSVKVFRQLTVAVFSTGDELLPVGSPARNDRIYDTNRPMLVAMLSRLGAKVLDLGIIADDKALIRAALEHANIHADCVITSGGVSVGEADYTREILEEYGKVEFWKLAIKPGKPLAFGKLPNSLFFGLPGNPVSSAVTFDHIATPALKFLAGCNDVPSMPLPAVASSAFKKRPGRTDYQRAYYFVDKKGQLCVETSVSQSSGVLSSFKTCNCYAILEQDRASVCIGEVVNILPFSVPII